MKIIVSIMLLLLYVAPLHGEDVAAVKSVDIRPYQDAVNGFKSSVNAEVNEYVLDYDDEKAARVVMYLNDDKMHLVFTLGSDALNLVKNSVKDIPVIFTFVLNPHEIIGHPAGKLPANMTGISMNIPPDVQFAALLEAAPHTKRIGVVYDPSKTSNLIEEGRIAARALGITLIAVSINAKSETINAISEMKGNVDALWMIPDTTAITRESAEYMLLFSLQNSIPLIGISEKYVKNGALMAFSFDSEDVGRQAGEIAQKILDGKKVMKVTPYRPRKLKLTLNSRIAKKLGLKLPENLIASAHKVY
ncbi:MAG: ABC transporter substrate-binding protein [Deltaproteobacteria bacterium]|nr:ABC transporter substrate-binding protein [Deltaproteobacteria bacterium]